MKPEYAKWIADHYPDAETARNQCAVATLDMMGAFPELIRARGWYGWTEHWWCKTADGEIIDPTRAQFVRDALYREFREGIDAEMVGKCMNCGDEIWNKDRVTLEPLEVYSAHLCSRACEDSFRTYLNSPDD